MITQGSQSHQMPKYKPMILTNTIMFPFEEKITYSPKILFICFSFVISTHYDFLLFTSLLPVHKYYFS